MSARSIHHRYSDPLDHIWIDTARRIGLTVVRDSGAYATTDTSRRLSIANGSALDDDDCLAQMIFHELCHSLVEGPEAFDRADWGLDNTSERHDYREHACLKVQAFLAARHGLRRLLAPTTDYRSFYDQLGPDPLADRRVESTALAIVAAQRSDKAPWAPHLGRALAATGAIARTAAEFAQPDVLWAELEPAAPIHPAGFCEHPSAESNCGSCVWREDTGRCRQSESDVDPGWRGCERFEAALDCQTCGACCRAAYGSVTIDADDPVIGKHPALVVRRETYIELGRRGDHCIALGGSVASGLACSIYEDRPRPCRDFERAGEHCIVARRRVGLSL